MSLSALAAFCIVNYRHDHAPMERFLETRHRGHHTNATAKLQSSWQLLDTPGGFDILNLIKSVSGGVSYL